jgi:hypothetical protein
MSLQSYPCPNGCSREFSSSRGYMTCVAPNATVTKRDEGHAGYFH